MPISTYILIGSILANLVLGLLVFLRNPKSRLSQVFFVAMLCIVSWIVSNYLTDNSNNLMQVTLTNRLSYLFAYLVFFFCAWFSFYFPNANKISREKYVIFLAVLFVGSALSVTDWVSGKVYSNDGRISFTTGPLTAIYGIILIALVMLIIYNLLTAYKTATKIEKSQISLMIFGFTATGLLAAITNVIIPVIANNWQTTQIGPILTVFLSGAVAYSITKHKLFDIKFVIFKLSGYILLIISISIVYGILAFIVVGRVLFGWTNVGLFQETIYTILAVGIAFSFPVVKQWFDRYTIKWFYQDAYDTREVLDEVSAVIVGNIDPNKIQKGALEALSNALKPSHVSFFLGGVSRLEKNVGSSTTEFEQNQRDLAMYLNVTNSGKKMIIYDELEFGSEKEKVIIGNADIAVISPLITKNETVGYLLLGPKKSGTIYNSQDVGLLKLVSNELAVALQNAQRFEEIQAFNITLQEKVNEATRELKRTNRKLIALDEAKDEFISMASHQLRTPLTSIKGYLSMLSEGDLGKLTTAQQKAIKEAFGSSQRMVFLIADFLNVSRIKTGKFVIELKEVDLPQIVSEELSQLKEMAGSRDITLVYDQPGVFPNLKLDDNKIRQVMMNMVDNAIYYTPAGGKVTIQLYVDGSDVVFKVTDTGIGVPKREQHKMFTKFFRAGNAKKARPDGTGLGLFMAQKIIVEQGGSVIFESTEGKGSTFGFRFPLSKIKA